MRVTFEVPDKVWGRLAMVADTRGVKIADILVGLIAQEVRERPAESVLRLHAAGYSMAAIAKALGMTNAAVKSRMYRHGLHANKPGKGMVS